MWRQVDVREDSEYGDITAIECQCLNKHCKKFFLREEKCQEKFCPHCGNRLGREWTKKNPRYQLPNVKMHYPYIKCYASCGNEWKFVDGSTLYPEEFVMDKREKINGVRYFYFHFKKNLRWINYSYPKSHIKIVIKRWDGTEKEIPAGEFK